MTPWIDFIFYGTFIFLEHPTKHAKKRCHFRGLKTEFCFQCLCKHTCATTIETCITTVKMRDNMFRILNHPILLLHFVNKSRATVGLFLRIISQDYFPA